MLLALLLAGGATGAFVSAQSRTSPSYDTGIPLGDALEQLATRASVRLVYDAELVEGHYTTCAVPDSASLRPAAALRCLLDDTDLDFVQTSGGTYVVKRDVRRPPPHGTVTGRVRSAEAPLPDAHVQVASASTGTVTGPDGRFRLPDLGAGRHTIVVSHVGYASETVSVRVSPADTTHRPVTLTPTSTTLDSVTVHASPLSPLPPSQQHATETLSPEDLERPGATGTPSVPHAAGRLLGVATEAPFADLHLQGSASSAHEVRLDGVPVRNPAAAGRLLGAFSPKAVDGLTAHKAGFGVLRGNARSGVLQLDHDLDRPETRHATVRADPVSLNGRAEGSVEIDGRTTTAMAAGRLGTWNVHQSYTLSRLIDTWSALDPVLTAAQLSADSLVTGGFSGRRARPRNRLYDLHGATRTDLGSGRSLFVSAYHGRSVLGTDLAPVSHLSSPAQESGPDRQSSVEIPTSDRYGWTNTLAQATYETPLDGRTTGRLQASLSRYRARSAFDLERVSLSLSETPSYAALASSAAGSSTSNAVTEVGLEGSLNIHVTEEDRFILQGSFTSLDSRFHLANAFAGPLRHTDRGTRLTAAGEADLSLGRFTTLKGGLRLTALNRGRIFAEPRAALHYRRSGADLGTVAARIGGGLYRRYTTQFAVSRDGATAVVPTAQVWMPVPSGHAPSRTYHLATELSWAPRPAWTVTAEGYSKWHPHLLAVDYPALRTATRPEQVLSASRGRAYGGGLRLAYEGAWGDGTLRYAHSRSRRTFPGRFDGRSVPVPWNAPHRLTLDMHLPVGRVLGLELRGTGVWGRRWGYQRAYYAYLGDGDSTLPMDPDHPERHRLPPLYRVDASLVATHSWGNVNLTGRVGLVNALGRDNVADWGLRPTGAGDLTRRARTLPGRRSILSLEVTY